MSAITNSAEATALPAQKSEVKEPLPAALSDLRKEEEEAKITEDLTYLRHGIFNPSKTKNEAIERFEASAQEYLDKHKVAVYLQDVVKIIIERKDEKPSDLLAE